MSLTLAPTAKKLGRKAHVTPVSLEISEGVSLDEWVSIGQQVLAAADTSRWWLADWLFHGEALYGSKYVEALAFTGLSYQTLQGLNYVSGRIEVLRRRNNLSFGHHREVAPLEPEQQDFWLDRAEREGLTRNELRDLIREQRALPPETDRTEILLERLRLTVPAERAERWKHAAAAAGLDFDAWVAQTLDEAAG